MSETEKREDKMSAMNVLMYGELPFRHVTVDDQQWFVAKDVCGALEIVNHNDALADFPDDERKGVAITDPLGKNPQEMTCVNEAGMYRLIFKSRKEAAEKLKTFVFSTVLPSIRKTGEFRKEPSGASHIMELQDYVKDRIRDDFKRLKSQRDAAWADNAEVRQMNDALNAENRRLMLEIIELQKNGVK